MANLRKEKMGRGKRYNPGITKSKILLYIAQNQPREFADIRKHIEQELKITTTKPVRDPLNMLVDEGFIKKEVAKSWGDYSIFKYSIVDDFKAFKYTYDFLKAYHLQKEFMRSLYYKKQIDTGSFAQKIFINLLGDSLRLLQPLVKYDEIRRFIENNSSKEEKDAYTDFENAMNSEDMSKLIDLFNKNTVDGLYTVIQENYNHLYESLVNGKEPNIDLHIFLLIIYCQNIIPEEDKSYIQKILGLSPSVIEFMIDTYHVSPIILMKILFNHMRNETRRFKKQTHELSSKNIDKSQTEKMNNDQTSEVNESPFIAIIKILFANDLLRGDVLSGDIPSELYDYAIPFNIKGSESV